MRYLSPLRPALGRELPNAVYLTTDHLGTPVADTAGALVWQIPLPFEGFGELRVGSVVRHEASLR